MRRAERIVTDSGELNQLLKSGNYGVLSMADNAGPYAVPVNFGWDGKNIYVHCATAGRKLEILKNSPRVFFTVVINDEIGAKANSHLACSYTNYFSSVCASGKAELLTAEASPEAHLYGMRCICAQYGLENLPIDPKVLKVTLLIKITPEEITGKRNRAPG